LIRHLQKGDAGALEAIIRQYTNYVSATAYRVLGPLPREDLEEVVADTFVALWTHAGDLEPDRGTLRAWLGAVAANKAKDRLRRYRPLELLTEDLPDGGSLEEQAEAKVLGEALWQAVDSLEEPERTLFFRYYYEGEKLKTVARDLGLNPSTAKTKLFRGRQALREKLRKLGGEALA
jgi:RNA polymerase sigma-70 factor (ECF subfamily)